MAKEKMYSVEYLEGAIRVKKNGIRITTTLIGKMQLEMELESLEKKLKISKDELSKCK